VSNAPFHAAMAEPHLGEVIHHLNTHEYFSVRPFLLGMSITSLCNPLGSNPARQRPLNYFRFLFESTTSYWTYFRLKTATHKVLINDEFPPEQAVLASQNVTRLVSSGTRSCQQWRSNAIYRSLIFARNAAPPLNTVVKAD